MTLDVEKATIILHKKIKLTTEKLETDRCLTKLNLITKRIRFNYIKISYAIYTNSCFSTLLNLNSASAIISVDQLELIIVFGMTIWMRRTSTKLQNCVIKVVGVCSSIPDAHY